MKEPLKKLIEVFGCLDDCLKTSPYADFLAPSVRETAERLFSGCQNETEKARLAYEFVRDRIAHSWDIQNHTITVTAPQVLAAGHGICHAKVNLFAALLRFAGIPTGFCYQKLTIGETPESGFVLHGMAAVWLPEAGRWVRLDVRGNKPGVDARFSLGPEQLAFPVRADLGEIDCPYVFPEPLSSVMCAMESNKDCMELYLHGLPAEIRAAEFPNSDKEK